LKVLWAPWRLAYVGSSQVAPGCIFCEKPRLAAAEDRRREMVLRTTETTSVIMNLFPYANGHLLVAPREHRADFARLGEGLRADLQRELALCVDVLSRAYSPAGFNLGMNLGRTAGAGIADHLHWHVVPRWEGDTNFMPMLADTRVIPQHIEDAYDRLLPLFEEAR
jgi:ATP adenylyltransferase